MKHKKWSLFIICLIAILLIIIGFVSEWLKGDSNKYQIEKYSSKEALEIVKKDYNNKAAIYEIINDTKEQVEIRVKIFDSDKEYTVYSFNKKTGEFIKGNGSTILTG